MYVSKLDKKDPEPLKTVTYNITRNIFTEEVQVVYAFDNMDDMLRACNRLLKSGFKGNAAAYANKVGDVAKKFYLTLIISEELYGFLPEYGEKYASENIIYYIKEHCTEICSNGAVNVLGNL